MPPSKFHRWLLKNKGLIWFALFLGLALPAGQAAELTVFAAASLTDALQSIKRDYEKNSPDRLVFNFGASSILERQIEAGAPCDLFISADEAKMDALEKKGMIKKETRKSLLSNVLVIITDKESLLQISSAKDLVRPEFKRIAIAEPRTVPAGIYAKEYLQKIQIWNQVTNRFVPAESVRGVLATVESGNVDAGIVYKTDAAISAKVKTIFEVPGNDGPKISYPMAVIEESSHPKEAAQFLEFLKSPAAAKRFETFGFIVLSQHDGR